MGFEFEMYEAIGSHCYINNGQRVNFFITKKEYNASAQAHLDHKNKIKQKVICNKCGSYLPKS